MQILSLVSVIEPLVLKRECADWLKWNCDFLQGDPGLLRRFLKGPWDEKDFLVVQPGETIVASFDERVITTEGRR